MGPDAKPAQLQPYIKKTFGYDMTPGHITTSKGELRRKAAKGKPSAKKQAPKAAVQPTSQPAKATASRAVNGRSGFSLEDIQAIKGLIGRRASPSPMA